MSSERRELFTYTHKFHFKVLGEMASQVKKENRLEYFLSSSMLFMYYS